MANEHWIRNDSGRYLFWAQIMPNRSWKSSAPQDRALHFLPMGARTHGVLCRGHLFICKCVSVLLFIRQQRWCCALCSVCLQVKLSCNAFSSDGYLREFFLEKELVHKNFFASFYESVWAAMQRCVGRVQPHSQLLLSPRCNIEIYYINT